METDNKELKEETTKKEAASYLEEKYVAEYSCRDHTLYDISASSILKQCEKAFFQPFHTVFLRN